jgi:hypothetical protein
MNNIESYQYQTFPPTEVTKNNLNKVNKNTDIKLNVGDSCIHPAAAELLMNFDVIHTNGRDYSEYEGKGNVKLINNYVPHIFSIITIKKGGTYY